tara:strand:+ start:1169 stop:2017 length:849 start_codon:yes stop_codon:yes gene_type:complete
MGFKMNGSPAKMGTISGTAGHSSALKMKVSENAASALKQMRLPGTIEQDAKNRAAKEKYKSENTTSAVGKIAKKALKSQAVTDVVEKEMKLSDRSSTKTKSNKAYGGSKTWSQGQKDSGNTLNDTTKSQRAYEKEMKSKDPKWNKREDNDWKKRQNKINASLGSKKVYDTTKDIATKDVDRTGDGVKETEVMKGLGSNKGKTLTTKEKSLEKANISTQKDILKKNRKSDKDKNIRDAAQGEIGQIRAGRDDAKTGTVVSRYFGKLKAKRNKRQLEKRKAKNA